MLKTYSSGSVNVKWNKIDLSHGWAEDTFLTVEPLAERKTTTFGADGQMCVSKSANNGAKITLTLQQTSTANKDIAKINAAESVLSFVSEDLAVSLFSIEDTSGDSANFYCWNAVLTEVPTNSFGNAAGEKTWTWICETYVETNDLVTLAKSAGDFVDSEVSVLNKVD